MVSLRVILALCLLAVPSLAFTSAVAGGRHSKQTALHLELPVDPLVLAAGGLAVVGGVGAVVITGKLRDMDGGEEGVSAPAAAVASTEVDLSIPYDAAAKMAYEAAGSPGDYEAFKAKYEADAVADVIAKQK